MVDIPIIIRAGREQTAGVSDEAISDRYYTHLRIVMDTKADPQTRLRSAMVCLSCMEGCIRYWKSMPGGEIPPFIPPMGIAMTFHAMNGARGQIENIREFIDFIPDLAPSSKYGVDECLQMLDLAARIREHLSAHPGTLQKDLKKAIGVTDGKLLARVVHYMEVAKQLERKPHDKTWELYRAGEP